ncbi:MAG: hypothetical protein AB1898_31670 [Acidobacteriota bacterium]
MGVAPEGLLTAVFSFRPTSPVRNIPPDQPGSARPSRDGDGEMYGTDDPEEMAPEACFREVAAILAKGLLRMATGGEILRHVANETEAEDSSVLAGSGTDETSESSKN